MKLGRWFYCKYCYKNICPTIGDDGSVVVCPECKSGLAPIEGVVKHGSLQAWYASIVAEYEKQHPWAKASVWDSNHPRLITKVVQ